jgi:hypothetical protein
MLYPFMVSMSVEGKPCTSCEKCNIIKVYLEAYEFVEAYVCMQDRGNLIFFMQFLDK